MHPARTSQGTCFRSLITLVSIIALVSCRPHSADADVELDAGNTFTITVKNNSDDFLDVDDRLLGRGLASSVKVEVAHSNGSIISFCRYVDYVGSGKTTRVAPQGETIISIPLSAITLTHCLPADESYLFRAVRLSDGKVVSRTEWVPFRAVSPMTDPNQTGQARLIR